MRTRLSRTTAPITWMLMLAFSVTLSASCTTEPAMTGAAMACCAAMGHACAKSGDEHDCCARGTSQIQQLLATKQRVDLTAPVLNSITAVILPPATLSDRQFSHVRHAVVTHPGPTRVPKYLLAASLLI
ncbi:MAG: hypothetical protein K2Y23_24730 [Cyanobacteria bacterium]|nr:hypothetical protein [Cyanobacteriota bacterium]